MQVNGKGYDILIIGGGVMGSATAYNLMRGDNTLKVCGNRNGSRL